jgi:hypothetical protein
MKMDLQSLLRGAGQAIRTMPEAVPAMISQVHSPEGMAVAREASQAAMETWCEILRKSRESGGFLEEDAGYQLIGRVPCGKSPTVRNSEVAPDNAATVSIGEDELIVPIHADVREDDLIAVPGWFNQWRDNHAYALDNQVTPSWFNTGEGPYFICVQAGLSGNNEPKFDMQRGLIEDGTVLWSWVGVAIYHEVKAVQKWAPDNTRKAIRTQVIRG